MLSLVSGAPRQVFLFAPSHKGGRFTGVVLRPRRLHIGEKRAFSTESFGAGDGAAVGLTGGGARGVPLRCGLMRAEKVFVPQDVKCRRDLCANYRG